MDSLAYCIVGIGSISKKIHDEPYYPNLNLCIEVNSHSNDAVDLAIVLIIIR